MTDSVSLCSVGSFCPSAIFDYLGGQLGDKMGENLQISKLKIKNLQKWTKF
jgi:phage tail tape-measure protein